MPGPTTPQDRRRNHGRHGNDKNVLSGAVNYFITLRDELKFLDTPSLGLLVADGEQRVAISVYDANGNLLPFNDKDAPLTVEVQTSGTASGTIENADPTEIPFESGHLGGNLSLEAGVLVAAPGTGSQVLTMVVTASSTGLTVTDTLTITWA